MNIVHTVPAAASIYALGFVALAVGNTEQNNTWVGTSIALAALVIFARFALDLVSQLRNRASMRPDVLERLAKLENEITHLLPARETLERLARIEQDVAYLRSQYAQYKISDVAPRKS